VVAPAMHTEMWRHPATTANVATLRERGVLIVGPADGPLTGGDSGPGRMSEPEDIVAAALALVSPAPADLDGLHVAVSTGGTREPLDPVRFLGNRARGRQGAEIAVEAARRGAAVTLVAASVDAGVLDAAAAHPRITIQHVETAAELGEAMSDAAAAAEVVIMVAAVADYRAARVSDHKLRKEDGPLETIELVPNDDILAGLAAARRDGQTVVGFAAETADSDLLVRARRKRDRKGVDLLVVNEVGWDAGFGAGENAVAVIGDGGAVVAEASGPKDAVARAIWDAIVALRAAS
jgi:phosphopantothenoylcysteine decarboxylase / phosphopantothenate---cysteine ligase